MIRKKKMYVKPRKMYVKARIQSENLLLEKYGLKNKREVWKTLAKINYFRSRAKELAKQSPEMQEILFSKLQAIGLSTNSIADVLALKIEDLLERRLPTVVAKLGIAKTPKEARQMVTHKRILIDNKVVNTPSYIVPVSYEKLIALKAKKSKPAQEPKEVSA